MKHILIAFKDINSLYSFSKNLRLNGINSNIINTPRNISTSCGLSLKTTLANYSKVMFLLKQKNYNILGLYIVEQIGLQEKIEKIL